MSMLQQIAQQQPQLPLEDFVDVANDLLPEFLPDQPSGSRGQEPVNARLVRHYTTQGWLDKPLKQGREARYTYRHLLQLLVLRRLLAEGYSASSIGSLTGGQTNPALEDLLQGGAQLTVETANPALAFLSQIRERPESAAANRSIHPHPPLAGPPAAPVPAALPLPTASPAPSPTPATSTWTRLAILDGLELHVRQDFGAPATAHERERLLQLIAEHLIHLNSSPRIPP